MYRMPHDFFLSHFHNLFDLCLGHHNDLYLDVGPHSDLYLDAGPQNDLCLDIDLHILCLDLNTEINFKISMYRLPPWLQFQFFVG